MAVIDKWQAPAARHHLAPSPMPIIAHFVAVSVIGLILMAVEALLEVARRIDAFVAGIGGWYVPAAFGAGLILLLAVLVRSGKRSERRDLLRVAPHQVDGRIAAAGAEYRRAAEAPERAAAELAADRAPLFWDAIEAAETALDGCANTLLATERMTDRYNDEVPAHKLKIPELDQLPPQALSRTRDLMGEQARIAQEALAVPVFAGVYEPRRAAAQQAQANAELMTALGPILDETERTADSADGARRASKRAAGDWF